VSDHPYGCSESTRVLLVRGVRLFVMRLELFALLSRDLIYSARSTGIIHGLAPRLLGRTFFLATVIFTRAINNPSLL
jgi:hypothetical protein